MKVDIQERQSPKCESSDSRRHVEANSVHKIIQNNSERPKPLFWFRSNTETETVIGRCFRLILKPIPKPKLLPKRCRNQYRNGYRN